MLYEGFRQKFNVSERFSVGICRNGFEDFYGIEVHGSADDITQVIQDIESMGYKPYYKNNDGLTDENKTYGIIFPIFEDCLLLCGLYDVFEYTGKDYVRGKTPSYSKAHYDKYGRIIF